MTVFSKLIILPKITTVFNKLVIQWNNSKGTSQIKTTGHAIVQHILWLLPHIISDTINKSNKILCSTKTKIIFFHLFDKFFVLTLILLHSFQPKTPPEFLKLMELYSLPPPTLCLPFPSYVYSNTWGNITNNSLNNGRLSGSCSQHLVIIW